MCTVVLLIRPGHAWPLLLAANRDERIDRPWDPPATYWPEHPGVLAGRDRTAGGTWMGINRAGVVAAVLNRRDSLGPAAGKRSRGELPLLALAQASAMGATTAVGRLDPGAYRPFNLVIADRHGALFVRGLGAGIVETRPFSPGTHMVTAHDPDDASSPRIARHLPRFRHAAPPEPPAAWGSWRDILADVSGPPGTELNIPARFGFGTVCASLLALPAVGSPNWLFAAGPPDAVAFRPVENS